MLARLLEEALESKAAGEAQGSACPDAEILAAYAEHGLPDREASRWEGHIADCSRCQEIIAGVVVGGENLEETRNEEQGSLAPAFVIRKPGPGASGISRRPGFWRWWVPGLGLATAVVLWFVLHPALPHQASPQPGSQSAAATTGTSQGAQGNPSASSTKPEETQMAEAKAPPPPPTTVSGAEVASGGAIRDSEEPRANSSADALKKAPKQESLQSEGQSEAQAPPVLDADRAAGTPEARAKDAEPPSAEAADQKKEKVEVSGETPAIATAAPSALQLAPPSAAAPQRSFGTSARASVSNQMQALAKSASSPIVFGSPDRSALWRVGPGGLIENSSDRGQTWRSEASGVTADLLAGAAPSAKVAWAVGRSGIIVRTEDGERWQRVMPPSFVDGVNGAGAQNAAAPDWISVEARDELHATIVSRDLRRYATADGGRTWVQQQ